MWPGGCGAHLNPAGVELPGAAEAVELLASDEAAGQRLDRWIAGRLPGVSRTRVQQWIALGAVEVDGLARAAKWRLAGGERVRVNPLPREAEQAFVPDPVPLAVVHEDDELLVIDKPAGLVVHPAAGHWRGTLMNGLLHHWPDSALLPRAGIVHRLDKDTSGLLMVARTERAMAALTDQLARRSAGRRYLALAWGRMPAAGTIDAPIGRDPVERVRMAVVASGKPARTHVAPLAYGRLGAQPVTLVLCRLETGRTHQIRVHLKHIGQALVGDALYGRPAAEAAPIARQALHAWRLTLAHPRSGAPVQWDSAPPADLAQALQAAGLDVAAALAQAAQLSEPHVPGSAATHALQARPDAQAAGTFGRPRR